MYLEYFYPTHPIKIILRAVYQIKPPTSPLVKAGVSIGGTQCTQSISPLPWHPPFPRVRAHPFLPGCGVFCLPPTLPDHFPPLPPSSQVTFFFNPSTAQGPPPASYRSPGLRHPARGGGGTLSRELRWLKDHRRSSLDKKPTTCRAGYPSPSEHYTRTAAAEGKNKQMNAAGEGNKNHRLEAREAWHGRNGHAVFRRRWWPGNGVEERGKMSTTLPHACRLVGPHWSPRPKDRPAPLQKHQIDFNSCHRL